MNEMDVSIAYTSTTSKLLAALRSFCHRIGWGVISTLAAVLLVALVSPRAALDGLRATGSDMLFLAPYLAAAFLLAGYMKAASVDVLVTKAFQGRPIVMIFAATALGTMTPFCSCTVVALIAVLLQSGTPLSAVMAFWIASPVISPDLFLYTAGILGIDVALARFLAAVFMALSSGLITLLIESMGGFKSPLRKSMAARAMPAGAALSPHWRFWQEQPRIAIFFAETRAAAVKIFPWMVLAIFLESLMTAYIPAEMVASWVGRSNAFAIPMAILVSIPTYANPIAGVPIVNGMVALGMTKSAALAYLVAGSVTTIPAMLAVLPLVRTRIFLWHIGVGLVTGSIAAYVFKFYLGE